MGFEKKNVRDNGCVCVCLKKERKRGRKEESESEENNFQKNTKRPTQLSFFFLLLNKGLCVDWCDIRDGSSQTFVICWSSCSCNCSPWRSVLFFFLFFFFFQFNSFLFFSLFFSVLNRTNRKWDKLKEIAKSSPGTLSFPVIDDVPGADVLTQAPEVFPPLLSKCF